ncbi:DUF6801 domain-containing protein [Amycolatopsis cihanbeyliensis]|uniref:DUF6801 domain-containing protein n=1 Tax=Amycolatopsis cihanbeyliensis TaxID=1128664 RepID=A0A542DMC2_AMYCI|nr:DUF6801 domain-containing protein [Amycolatopsis cihanbeyliensis]TQJ04229.1 hypothetical protein FB471_4012 [Amycolatopsis cihanbeyliensis]
MPRSLSMVVVVSAVTAMLTAPAAAARASTIEVDKELTYTCEFPYLVPQELSGTVRVSLPDSVAVGERFRAHSDVTIALTLNEDIVTVLNLLEAATFDGAARADVDADINGLRATLGIPGLRIPRTEVPVEQSLPVDITGTMPSLIAYEPGTLTLAAGAEFTATIDARRADGSPIELGEFDVSCAITETEPPQDPHLATIPITE